METIANGMNLKCAQRATLSHKRDSSKQYLQENGQDARMCLQPHKGGPLTIGLGPPTAEIAEESHLLHNRCKRICDEGQVIGYVML
jgi:hypothetical protein